MRRAEQQRSQIKRGYISGQALIERPGLVAAGGARGRSFADGKPITRPNGKVARRRLDTSGRSLSVTFLRFRQAEDSDLVELMGGGHG